jgi:hypothetical protein
MTARPALIAPRLSASSATPLAEIASLWAREGRRSQLAYAVGLYAAAVVAALLVRVEIPSDQPAYAPLTAAVMAGALLSVRLARGQGPATFRLVPTQVAYAAVDSAALVPFVAAGIFGSLVRGARVTAVLAAAAQDVVSFALAHIVAQSVTAEPGPSSIVFALVLGGCRWSLCLLATRLGYPPALDPASERPNLILAWGLVPLALLPIAAATRLGEGASLLSLAGLCCVLFVAREVANGANARAAAETRTRRLVDAGELHQVVSSRLAKEIRLRLADSTAAIQAGRDALGDGDPDTVLACLGRVEDNTRVALRLLESFSGLPNWAGSTAEPPPLHQGSRATGNR